MVLDEAEAEELLGDGRQAETLQAHQARRDLGIEERRGAQANLAKIRQILQRVVQQPHVLHARLKHGQVGEGVRVDQKRADVLASDLHQVRVGAVAEALSALHVERNGTRTSGQRAGGRFEVALGVNDGRGAPTRLRDELRIVRIALR